MRDEMLKQADEWLYSMECLLSVKTDEEDRAYTQKRIDLFNWLIEQSEQNKRYREAIDKIMECVNEHLSDGTEINPYKIDDIVDEYKALEETE